MNRKALSRIGIVLGLCIVIILGSYFVLKHFTGTPPSLPQDTQTKSVANENSSSTPPPQTPPANKEYQKEIIFEAKTEKFPLVPDVEAQIVKIEKYFADGSGNLAIAIAPSVPGATAEAIFQLTPGQVVLTADIDFTNTSLKNTAVVDFTKNFRIESASKVYYARGADYLSSYDKITLLPRANQERRLFFTIPENAEVLDFWYGTSFSNLINGFTIDLKSKLVESFKG